MWEGFHMWARPEERQGLVTLSNLSTPTMYHAIYVNALNYYCRLSLLFPAGASKPSRQLWPHAIIGVPPNTSATAFSDGRLSSKSGIIMSMHIFDAGSFAPLSSTSARELRLRNDE
ncbi:uncharacterized protein EDB91DRAFT_100881 [Suillus paluster]|uniref:uncharacterized protein n=1 Tax=Suillus paluster TaxID=48578 RepID=UPI001B86E92E|nr:uncharacterized protein EDB91DRAFT_100881 [Suillus paluster]KAG1746568.1 hypothetical protein EDB91DRAFT_100881 [Suillus paluster]